MKENGEIIMQWVTICFILFLMGMPAYFFLTSIPVETKPNVELEVTDQTNVFVNNKHDKELVNNFKIPENIIVQKNINGKYRWGFNVHGGTWSTKYNTKEEMIEDIKEQTWKDVK